MGDPVILGIAVTCLSELARLLIRRNSSWQATLWLVSVAGIALIVIGIWL